MADLPGISIEELTELLVPSKTCRYHPEVALVAVQGVYALLEPPPYTVVHNVGGGLLSGPVDRVAPGSVKVFAWYCPKCSYLELHYK